MIASKVSVLCLCLAIAVCSCFELLCKAFWGISTSNEKRADCQIIDHCCDFLSENQTVFIVPLTLGWLRLPWQYLLWCSMRPCSDAQGLPWSLRRIHWGFIFWSWAAHGVASWSAIVRGYMFICHYWTSSTSSPPLPLVIIMTPSGILLLEIWPLFSRLWGRLCCCV